MAVTGKRLLSNVRPGTKVLIEAYVVRQVGGELTFVRFDGGQRWYVQGTKILVREGDK